MTTKRFLQTLAVSLSPSKLHLILPIAAVFFPPVIVSAPVRRRGWPTGATQRDGSRGLPRNVMKAGHLQEFSSTVRFDGATTRGDARGVHARHRRREGRGRTSWLSFITFHVALDGRRRGRGGFDRWPAGTGCRGAIETRLGEVRRRGLGSRRGDGRSGRSGRGSGRGNLGDSESHWEICFKIVAAVITDKMG